MTRLRATTLQLEMTNKFSEWGSIGEGAAIRDAVKLGHRVIVTPDTVVPAEPTVPAGTLEDRRRPLFSRSTNDGGAGLCYERLSDTGRLAISDQVRELPTSKQLLLENGLSVCSEEKN